MSELFAPPPGHSSRAPGTRQSSLDRVHQALQTAGLMPRSTGTNQLMAHCPVHPERTGSLHVTWQHGPRGGLTLLNCFGCQAPADEIAAGLGLSLADLFDEPLPERDRAVTRVGKSTARRRAGQRRGKLGPLPTPIAPAPGGDAEDHDEHEWVEVTRYPYRDLEDRLVQEVVREECTAGDLPHKQFRQQFVTAAGQLVKRKPAGFEPVLFRASAVAAAVRDGRPVWLVEGEKDAETAEALGVTATTNAQGGRSFPDSLIDALAGAQVRVVLDRDPTGWARGVELHTKLSAVDAQVTLLLPMTTAAKSDLRDHVEAGHSLEQLLLVHVDEVRTWDALSGAQARFRAVLQAVAEVDARVAAAAEARSDGAVGALREAQQHTTFARRWALESQLRQEALLDQVDKVIGHGLRVGTEWAGEAIDAAGELLRIATERARTCHDTAGVAVPPSLRDVHAGPDHSAPGARATQDQDPPAAPPASAAGHPQPPASADHAAHPDTGQDRPASPGFDWRGRALGEESSAGAHITAPAFRVLDGAIAQWVPSRKEGEEGSFKSVLSMAVRVVRREFLEVDLPHELDEPQAVSRAEDAQLQARVNPAAPRQLIAVVVAYLDPLTGEEMQLRVAAESWKDHSWLESLPGPVDYDHRRAGLDTVRRAILAISEGVEDAVLFRSTGWRSDAGTHRFVHAGGAITANGAVQAAVAFSGPLVQFDLPAPTRDATELRAAFLEHSAGMLDRLPDRVAAPLLGWIYRAVLGHNPWVMTLVGPPGSYKTSVAAKAMQHFGERWEHSKPGSSMSGNGDTFNALRFKLHGAKDLPWWCDDFAPTKSWLDAQRLLEETARLIHNQEGRSRSSRDGLSISDGGRPRASGLFTSEVMPRPGSGAERMLVLPLARTDIDTTHLFPLDAAESRHARALVMASFIQWLAGDLDTYQTHYLALADTWADQLSEGPTGLPVRQSAAIAHTLTGWAAMTDYLVEAGAITTDEQHQLLQRAQTAALEAAEAATDPDLPSRPGARALEALRYALRSGIAYVDDVRTGGCPPWPLAGRLGWRRTVVDAGPAGSTPRTRDDREGKRLGYVLADPERRDRGRVLMMDSAELEAVLKAATATMAERFELDRSTACRALYEEGALIADESEMAQGKIRWTLKNTLHCENRSGRMVTLWLDRVLGDEPDDDSDDEADDDGNQGPPSVDPVTGVGSGLTLLGFGSPAPGAGPAGEPGNAGDSAPQTAAAGTVAGANDGEISEDVGGAHVGGDVSGDVGGRTYGAQDVECEGQDESMPIQQPMQQQPRPLTDLDGVVGWTSMAEGTAPCVLCTVRCGVLVDGLRIHLLCWERSTAEQRAAGTGGSRQKQADEQPAEVQAPQPAEVRPGAPAEMPRGTTRPERQDRAPGAPTARSSAPAPTGRQVRAASRFRAAAAVVDVDGIWLSSGEHLPLPGTVRHLGDLVDLAGELGLGASITRYRDASGQIWLGDRLLEQLGVDVAAIAGAPARDRDKVARQASRALAAATVEAGYSLGGPGGDSLGRWTRCWRGAQQSIWIVLMPALDDEESVPLLQGGPDHAGLARRIGLLAEQLGYPYQLSGATTGIDLMIALRWQDRKKLFDPLPVPAAAENGNVEPDISWCRPPTEEEAKHQFLHAFDRGGSYLAGVAELELPIGEFEHHPEGLEFQKQLPGYWKIRMDAAADWRMPHPMDPLGAWSGMERWVTTPTLEFGEKLGYRPQILEAYTWREHGRLMNRWYEQLRDGRAALDAAAHMAAGDPDAAAALGQLKMVYAQTIGMMGSKEYLADKAGYAPHRRHHIVAKSRSNLHRQIVTIGERSDRWPVAVHKDTIIYTSPEADPQAAWPGLSTKYGRGLGQYKPEAWAPMAEHAQFLTGGRYTGKKHLLDYPVIGGE